MVKTGTLRNTILQEGEIKKNLKRVVRTVQLPLDVISYPAHWALNKAHNLADEHIFSSSPYKKYKKIEQNRTGKHRIASSLLHLGKAVALNKVIGAPPMFAYMNIAAAGHHAREQSNMREELKKAGLLKKFNKYEDERDRKEEATNRRLLNQSLKDHKNRILNYVDDMKNMGGNSFFSWRDNPKQKSIFKN